MLKSLPIMLCLVALLSGCISPRSFVDPTYSTTKYEDIKKQSEPLKLKVSVEFEREGEPYPKADSTLRDNVERVLRASGLIIPTPDSASGEIKVVINNYGDRGAAAAKGFGTGLTFGLVGNTVIDFYEMDITITQNGKVIKRSGIKHAIHTMIGNTSAPDGVELLPPPTAFSRVVEQMLLNGLKDMQQHGELSALPPSILDQMLSWL